MTIRAVMGTLLLSAAVSGCVPSSVFGPLQHEQDERERLLTRSKKAGVSEDVLNSIDPPLTPEEAQAVQPQNKSCRASYLWKNGLTWTGGIMVGVAAGFTIGGAYATSLDDTNGKVLFGVSAGSLAALGSVLVAVGGIVQQGFTDRGCWVR
jgi:hypothetical protein